MRGTSVGGNRLFLDSTGCVVRGVFDCSFTILVLRTRSEAIGSAFQPEAKKFEARNIRISDLRHLQGFMPSGLNPKPGPPGSDLYFNAAA